MYPQVAGSTPASLTMPVSPRTQKPLLVGEQNPYGGDSYYALYPSPEGCSGDRLCRLVLGMHRSVYLEVFDRTNLCDGPWVASDARRRAVEIVSESRSKIVLLGSKVCRAFGVVYHPFERFSRYLVLPHPSGLCRLWNEPGAFQRARDCVALLAPHLYDHLGAIYASVPEAAIRGEG